MRNNTHWVLFAIVLMASISVVSPASAQRGQGASKRSRLNDRKLSELALRAAQNYYRETHYAQAAILLEKARYHNASANVSHQLAVCYAQLDVTDKAEQEFRKALEQAPKDANLLSDIGCYYLRAGRISEAMQALQRAVNLSPNHARAKMNLAECYVRAGQLQEGVTTYREVVGESAALANAGILLAKSGDQQDQAQKLLRAALRQNPNLHSAQAVLQRIE